MELADAADGRPVGQLAKFSLVVSGSLWPSLAVSGNLWQSLAVAGRLWLPLVDSC